MTSADIALVQSSFAMVEPIAWQAADIFFVRLFRLDPDLKPLFPNKPAQGRQMAKMLGSLVGSLPRLDSLAPTMRALGDHHAGLGIRPAQYGLFVEALLATLQASLGTAFTEDHRAAWTAACDAVVAQMQAGAA